MSRISPATLLASPSSLSSPTPTDIQDTQSSHSENQQPQQESSQRTPKTTEYKSNYKPFDQYVYNEITDSFVKQNSLTANNSNNLPIDSSGPIGGSNQDLHALSSISPALEVTSFEPSNGAADQHYDVTKEPWYKEVVKRNEKANEYRFKSEVGHNSPLLKQADDGNAAGLSNDELSAPSMIDEQQHGCATVSPAPTNPDELSSRRSYNFTPHDYKRDHLIATMANNNNFKLPKEEHSQHQERSRRAQPTSGAARTATSSARPLTRTTASSRARSQSSRPLANPTGGPTKAEPASKSNQSSPIKTAATRNATTRAPLASARASAPRSTNGAPTGAVRTPARTSTLSTNSTRTSVTATRRLPTSTVTTPTTRPTTATSRLASTNKTAPSARPAATSTSRASTARAPTLNTSSRSAATRTPSASTTGTITISSSKARTSPVKKPTTQASPSKTATRPTMATPARNSLNRSPASRNGSMSGAASTASNEPKSIKSKALADAGEKTAAAAAAAAALTGVGVASFTEPEQAASALADKQEPIASLTEVTSLQAESQPNASYYLNEEPNLIITTTETGNMLADEIARAEKTAQEETLRAQREITEQNLDLTQAQSGTDLAAEITPETPQKSQQEEKVRDEQSSEKLDLGRDNAPSGELINGLSGGIVSAEDTYDLSERESSAEFNSQQLGRSANDQEEREEEDDDDQEPYSLMPTTYNAARQEEPSTAQQYVDEAFKGENNLVDSRPFGNEASNDSNRSGEMQYGELTEKQKSDEGKHVDFDPNVRAKSDDSLHEPEVIESRVSVKLESGHSAEEETEEPVPTSEHAVREEQQINDLTDEPYEHLEPEPEPDFQPPDEQLQSTNQSSVEPTRAKNDDLFDDDFEILGEDAFKKDPETTGSNQADIEPEPVQSEVASTEQAGDQAQVQDQKSNISEDMKESDVEKPEREEKKEVEEELRGDQDLALAEEPLIIKTVDGHKLTEEIDQIGDPVEKEDEEKLEDSAEPHSVFVPQSDELDDMGAERRQSIDIDDQQASRIDEHSNESLSSQSEGASSNRVGDHEQIYSVNKASESQDHGEDGGQVHEEITSRNELLMNVADLVEAQTRVKEEMTRKSALAREQSNSRGSLTFSQAGEILLSADQLNEHLGLSQGDNSSGNVAKLGQEEKGKQQDKDKGHASTIVPLDHEVSDYLDATSQQLQREQQFDLEGVQTRSSAPTQDHTESDREILPVQKLEPLDQQQQQQQQEKPLSTDDLVNFGSLTPTPAQPQHDQFQSTDGERLDLMSSDADEQQQQHQQYQQQEQLVNRDPISTQETRSSNNPLEAPISDQKQAIATDQLEKPNNLLYDDLMEDDDEQQKLSNHLTNSDDDAILAPRNTKETLVDDCFSSQKAAIGSRYNEGAGLSSMIQHLDTELDNSEREAELGDGSSAAVDAPTVAEERAELATSKSLMPDLHTLGSTPFVSKLSSQRTGFESDDDDEQDLGLNPNVDPIDVAATLSPRSSAAEEMMRLSRQTSNASISSGAVSKLVEEMRSDKLTSESLEKDADTYISGGVGANMETQHRNPDEPPAPREYGNNNNNETERHATNDETDETGAHLMQRKSSSESDGASGDRKGVEVVAGQLDGSAGTGRVAND